MAQIFSSDFHPSLGTLASSLNIFKHNCQASNEYSIIQILNPGHFAIKNAQMSQRALEEHASPKAELCFTYSSSFCSEHSWLGEVPLPLSAQANSY